MTNVAEPTSVGAANVRVGIRGWAERSLVKDSDWYPRRSMRAAERMATYASRLPLVELDATHRFPPTPDLSRQLVERTPDGFTIDVHGWTLLTGLPTLPDSVWPDLLGEVDPRARDKRRLYDHHLSPDGRAEAWRRWNHALDPLREAGRLGAVILSFPRWLGPKDEARATIAAAVERMAGTAVAVELRNDRWLAADACEDTLGFLEDIGAAFVCTDGRGLPLLTAATADLAVVRLWGHGTEETWWAYRYSDEELEAWADRIAQLASSASDVHVVFANSHRDDAAVNAETLVARLRGVSPAPGTRR